jgi:hypothetical protein
MPMLEYHAHIASLDAAKSAVLAMGEPELVDALSAAGAALDQHPDIARLGSLLDAILSNAESDGLELDLLRQASDLWERCLALYRDLDTAKVEFELSLVRTDLPDAVEILQLGINRLYDLSQACGALIEELKAMHDAIAPLDHLKPHPRQSDISASDWSWGDAFLGRRTFALVQALFNNAADERGLAFAMGALGGYAGNAAGSAYLGSVVGGPRRLHRYRDRLARNTLGTFMHQHAGTPPLSELGQLLLLGGHREAPALPPDLGDQLRAALNEAYPSRPVPDLDIGYQRMLEHLDLLSRFRMPDPPQPPIVPLSGDSIGGGTFDDGFPDPAGPPDVSVGGPPDITVGGGGGLDPGPSSSKSSAGGACLAILAVLGIFVGVTFVIFLIWCIDRRLRDKDCSPSEFLDDSSDPPDPRDPPITQDELTVMREPNKTGQLLQNVFQLQMRLWQGFEGARAFLTVTGLIYPTKEALALPLHRQFLQPRETSDWPLREDPQAEQTYHRFPTTSPEQPTIAGEVFPSSRPPEWLLHPDPIDNDFAVSQIAVEAFRAVHDLDARFNLDGDADRGHHHPCWSVSPGTSINDAVLSVDLLLFEEE